MKLSVGQLLQVYLTKNSMTQSDLALKAGCSRCMVNLVLHNHKKPGYGLALRMATALTDDLLEQEGLRFFLLGIHKKVTKLMKDYPHAFEDFRTTGNRKDNKGIRVY